MGCGVIYSLLGTKSLLAVETPAFLDQAAKAFQIFFYLFSPLTLAFACWQFSAGRAAALISRFSSAEFIELRSLVDEFCAKRLAGKSPREQIEECRRLFARASSSDFIGFNKMHSFCMYFAEIGVALSWWTIRPRHFKVLDRLVPYYWNRMAPFITACHIEFLFGDRIQNDVWLHEHKNLAIFNHFRIAVEKLGYRKLLTEPSSSLMKPAEHYSIPKWLPF